MVRLTSSPETADDQPNAQMTKKGSTRRVQDKLKRALGRLGITRQTVDRRLDRLRFALDTSPSLDYHPLPWLGKEHGQRVGGTESRWRVIETVVDELPIGSAVDVGANVGWFSISLAKRGIPTLAIEREPKFFRTLLYARSRLDLDDLSVLITSLDEHNLAAVPKSDLMLFLSVWHHLVKAHGYEAAVGLLSQLWARTEQVMFFDTGEKELPPDYGLPSLDPTAEVVLSDMLKRACPEGTVVRYGRHEAFAPTGEPCQRTLYAIFRKAAPTDLSLAP
jgi:hypothetical protein